VDHNLLMPRPTCRQSSLLWPGSIVRGHARIITYSIVTSRSNCRAGTLVFFIYVSLMAEI